MLKDYFVYMLECSNGSFYTGYTTDIQRRFEEHVQGTAKCKYTRIYPPVRIAACWKIADKDSSQARSIEACIKRLNVAKKRGLVAEPEKIKAFFGLQAVSVVE